MRFFDPDQAAYRATRTNLEARQLIRVAARNRETGATETMGLWTGDDHREIAVEGVLQTWFAAGSVLEIEPIRAGIGLEVRMLQVILTPFTEEASELLRGFDLRLAPVTIHEVLLDPLSGALVGQPFGVFRGFVNELSIATGAAGVAGGAGAGSATVTLASAARALTRTLPAFRSDAAMRLRSETDAFRSYTDIAGEVGVWWGEKRA